MRVQYKYELKTWAVFLATIFVSFFVHELGHCGVAWCYGLGAIPTPAKEYLLNTNIPAHINEAISLGGPAATALFTVAAIAFFITSRYTYRSAVLAGGLATPGIYVVSFLLKGRGHDAAEFQEAQSALGLPYAGHSLDWFFVTLFLAGAATWVIRAKPGYKIIPRLLAGCIIGLVFTVTLQVINNKLFDPLLLPKTTMAK